MAKRVTLLFGDDDAAVLKRATERAGLNQTAFCRQAVDHRLTGRPLFDQAERCELANLCRALDDARGVLERPTESAVSYRGRMAGGH
jgi:hypothetical protein